MEVLLLSPVSLSTATYSTSGNVSYVPPVFLFHSLTLLVTMVVSLFIVFQSLNSLMRVISAGSNIFCICKVKTEGYWRF